MIDIAFKFLKIKDGWKTGSQKRQEVQEKKLSNHL